MRRRVGFIAFQLLVWHYSACINAASFLSSSGISPSPFKSCFHRRTHRAAFAVVSVFFKSFIWTDLGLSMRTRGWWKWKEGKKSLKKAERAENKILGREIQYSPWFQFVIIIQELMVQTFLGKDLGTKCSGQSSNCSRTKVPLHHLVRRVYSFDALKTLKSKRKRPKSVFKSEQPMKVLNYEVGLNSRIVKKGFYGAYFEMFYSHFGYQFYMYFFVFNIF